MGLKETIINGGKEVMADMGLKGAFFGSTKGVLADQWKEFFYCDSMAADTLLVKGVKRTSDRSANTRGSDNVITSGSIIVVADGQCAIIVDQGRIAELCAQPGQYEYDASSEPSIFAGKLGPNILETFKEMGKRFTFGGEPPKDQRIYYINTKELIGNKYGTPNPVPFRVVDKNVGLDVDITIRCFGEYSYRIADPMRFYTNLCANVRTNFTRSEIDSQLKSEVMTALQPAFGRISAMGIRYSALPGHTAELAQAMNQELSEKWGRLRGLEIVSFGVSSVKASEEDEKMIKDLQRTAAYRDPGMAGAQLVQAQAEAMKAAASNEATGPAFAFMGMNMAAQAGGLNANTLFQMAANQPRQEQTTPAAGGWNCSCGSVATGNFCPQCGSKKPEPKRADGWVCPGCGASVQGNFCPDCGSKKPETRPEGWTCSCGSVNMGKFCPNCGAKRPADAPVYQCDKCGWKPADPKNPPRFCPECGDPFNEADAT